MTQPALTNNYLISLITFFDQDLRSYTTDGGKAGLRFALLTLHIEALRKSY